MTKGEFLERLRQALANDLSGPVIQDNVRYYDSYISEEVRNGRSETAVIDELGDPWAIAKTIIESEGAKGGSYEEYTYEPGRQSYEREQKGRSPHVHVFGIDSWWKKLLLVLGLIGVVMLVIAVIGGIFSILAPLIVPVLVIAFVFRILGDRRR